MVKKKYNYDTDKCNQRTNLRGIWGTPIRGRIHNIHDLDHTPWTQDVGKWVPQCTGGLLRHGRIFLLKHYGQLMAYIYLFYDWWRWWRPLLVYAGIFIIFLYVYQLPVAWPMMIQVVADFIGFYKVSASSEWTEISAGVSLLVFYFMVCIWLSSHLWRHFFPYVLSSILFWFSYIGMELVLFSSMYLLLLSPWK